MEKTTLNDSKTFTAASASKPERAWLLALVALIASCSTLEAINPFSDSEEAAWRDSVRDWRERRLAELTAENGWLTLVDMIWLRPGAQTLGAAADNDLVLPGGPPRWGRLLNTSESLRFQTAPGVDVRVDGRLVEEAELTGDDRGEPTVVASGSVNFIVIHRGKPALRVRDNNAPARTEFAGLDYFPLDAKWRFDAEFTPHPPGRKIVVANVLGQIEEMDNPGEVMFRHQGETYRLQAILEEPDDDRLFFVFADRTNGRETYGASRFLYAPLPVEGRIVLDFNRAYNPPCAFTEYSTCPLPPAGNRLDLWITAGERKYRGRPGWQPPQNPATPGR